MNAGLAAVLGAVVGAIGSGGAAIATSFIGHGQARMQIKAEHVRILREPRRNAYMLFAECTQQIHDLHASASRSAASASVDAGPQREEELQEAANVYKQAGDLFHGELQRLLAGVTVEGPADVTDAALQAVDALLTDRGTLHRWIRFLENDTATQEHETESEDAHAAAHRERVKFLNKASHALADDGLSKRA